MPFDAETEARVRASFARQQAMATVGAVLEEVRAGEIKVRLPYDEKLTQQHGFVHAGVIAMIADNACGYAALLVMPADAAVLTTEFKMNLLSPARGDHLMAHGRVVRPGRKSWSASPRCLRTKATA